MDLSNLSPALITIWNYLDITDKIVCKNINKTWYQLWKKECVNLIVNKFPGNDNCYVIIINKKMKGEYIRKAISFYLNNNNIKLITKMPTNYSNLCVSIENKLIYNNTNLSNIKNFNTIVCWWTGKKHI